MISKRIKIVVAISTLLLLVVGCELFNNNSKYSKINIRIPGGSRSLTSADIEVYELRVTGSGFDEIVETSTDGSFSLEVLSGSDRTFELICFSEEKKSLYMWEILLLL